MGGVVLVVLAVALVGCSAQPRAVVATPAPLRPLAESSVSCFGFTVRLSLLAAGSTDGAEPSPAVRGVSWRVAVDGPPDLPPHTAMTASLDAFTIRGDQANRLDLALLRSSGAARTLAGEGPLRVPDIHGEIRSGDQVRISAWVQTPRGQFGVRGFTFGLRAPPDGLEALTPAVLPQEECPAP